MNRDQINLTKKGKSLSMLLNEPCIPNTCANELTYLLQN